MVSAHDLLRDRLGRVGVWTFAFDGRPWSQVAVDVTAIESLGYPALWVPEGGGSRDVTSHLALLLGASERLTVCSGIANITAREPDVLQAAALTLADAFGDRLVLGVGVGHEYTTERRGREWDGPLDRMRAYLDRMDASQHLPAPASPPQRMLAALGDGMLRLSAERALGAHSYFVPVEHTAHAREVLGPDPVLAVEQTVVLSSDPIEAHRIGRAWTGDYLELPNYANNWRRLGYGDADVSGGGSDRLVDAAIAWGDADAVVERVRSHLDAGADHVCVQLISDDDAEVGVPQLRELAPALQAL
ncbi:MAG TPA: TIGR03620 family F420-dependent LLM class oxidoreductase [Actinomycetota bacterium]|nr:TIGR03620 family F420-dependent LLM class oxidoreductase [Actinomycetota bacterium]